MDAVIIGAENAHPSKCPQVRFVAGFSPPVGPS
jgi:hypothetical protein